MKKLNVLLMVLLTIVVIRKVDYILVPDNYRGKESYREEIKIICEEGIMLIPRRNVINDFIPYGKVKMIKVDSARYIFIKIEEDNN